MDNTIFPLPFTAHMIFVAVAFIFFIIQFIRVRYKYQLVLAVAVALTSLVYVQDTRLWFYGIGILEIGLLIIAFVASIIEKRGRNAVAASADVAEEALEADGEPEETEQAAETSDESAGNEK